MNHSHSARVFLSASVPLPTRHPKYFATADILAIRDAVRALALVIVEQKLQLVFGGHPAITPMIRLQLAQAGGRVNEQVVLFQSRYWEPEFIPDNAMFERVELVDAVPNDREQSLRVMREAMLTGPFIAGIFIGGMEGVEEEYRLFQQRHPNTLAFPIASTGAAAGIIYHGDLDLANAYPQLLEELSYPVLMRNIMSWTKE